MREHEVADQSRIAVIKAVLTNIIRNKDKQGEIIKISESDIQMMGKNKATFTYEQLFGSVDRKTVLLKFHPDKNPPELRENFTQFFQFLMELIGAQSVSSAKCDDEVVHFNETELDPYQSFCQQHDLPAQIPQVKYLFSDSDSDRNQRVNFEKNLNRIVLCESDNMPANPVDSKQLSVTKDKIQLASMKAFLENDDRVHYWRSTEAGYLSEKGRLNLTIQINPDGKPERIITEYYSIFIAEYVEALAWLRTPYPQDDTGRMVPERVFYRNTRLSTAGLYFLLATERQLSHCFSNAFRNDDGNRLIRMLTSSLLNGGFEKDQPPLYDLLFFIGLYKKTFVAALEQDKTEHSVLLPLFDCVADEHRLSFMLNIDRYLASLSYIFNTQGCCFAEHLTWNLFLVLANYQAEINENINNTTPDFIIDCSNKIFDRICHEYFSEILKKKKQEDPSIMLTARASMVHETSTKRESEKYRSLSKKAGYKCARFLKKTLGAKKPSREQQKEIDDLLNPSIDGISARVSDVINSRDNSSHHPPLFFQLPTIYRTNVREKLLITECVEQTPRASSKDDTADQHILSMGKAGLINIFMDKPEFLDNWIRAVKNKVDNLSVADFIVERLGFNHRFKYDVVKHLVKMAFDQFYKESDRSVLSVVSSSLPSFFSSLLRSDENVLIEEINKLLDDPQRTADEKLSRLKDLLEEKLDTLNSKPIESPDFVLLVEALVWHHIVVTPNEKEPVYKVNSAWANVCTLRIENRGDAAPPALAR